MIRSDSFVPIGKNGNAGKIPWGASSESRISKSDFVKPFIVIHRGSPKILQYMCACICLPFFQKKELDLLAQSNQNFLIPANDADNHALNLHLVFGINKRLQRF